MIVCTICGNSGDSSQFSITHTCTTPHLESSYGHATYGEVFSRRDGVPYVGATWVDPATNVRVYANVPADRVTVI